MSSTGASSIWYVDASDPGTVIRTNPLDPDAAHALARHLYPDRDVVSLGPTDLAGKAAPDAHTLYIGYWPGVTMVCSAQLALPRPSQLPEAMVRPLASEQTYLIGINPDLGWGGFAHWERGLFRRAFSATHVHILEDVGLPWSWERPFWAGDHPMTSEWNPHQLPFDPVNFADTANELWLGFRHNPLPERPCASLDAHGITVCGFALYPAGQAPRGSGSSIPDDASELETRSFKKWLWRLTSSGATRASRE